MTKGKFIYIGFFLYYLFCFQFSAQDLIAQKNSLDEHIFLTCYINDNVTTKLSEGYSALIIPAGSSASSLLDQVASHTSYSQTEFLVLIFDHHIPNLDTLIAHHPIKKWICRTDDNSIYNLDQCRQLGRKIFIFSPVKSDYSFSIEENICTYHVPVNFPSDLASGFSENKKNNLILFGLDDNIATVADSLKNALWQVPQLFNQYTGKLPNFFATKHTDIFFSYKRHFEKSAFYTATVLFNDEPLDDVSWSDLPNLATSGRLHTPQARLSPQKKGYRFSPDVFQFNELTSKETKVFVASTRQLNEEQVLYLDFNKHINNHINPSSHVPYSNIPFIKDETRGTCSSFDGVSQYIDYGTDIKLQSNITISVWINPAEIENNHSIIGKGAAFSVKFRNGKLLFTSTGIKDHISDSAIVEKNTWQHIAFVFSAGEKVRFFKNGAFIDEKDAAEIVSTNHSLLIGTNLWDEYFHGKMDELSLWNRALSDREIALIYQQSALHQHPSAVNMAILLGALSLIVIALAIGWRWRSAKKNSETKSSSYKNETQLVLLEQEEETTASKGPSIELFGGFCLHNRQGQDLTQHFSTRRKQIFVLILIATFRDNGISSKQLTDKVWAGHSPGSAKNNRSTQIQRIREILAHNTGMAIHFHNKKWTVELDADVFCDLEQYYALLGKMKRNGIQEAIQPFLTIIEKGAILPHMEDEYLDEFKSNISDELLDILLPLVQNREVMSDLHLVIRISNALLHFDPLNEIALKYKINALVKLGKKTQALESFDHYSKQYLLAYNQAWELKYSDLLV